MSDKPIRISRKPSDPNYGKRGKGKYVADYRAKHLYKYYKINTDPKIAVNNGVFYKVIQDLNNSFWDKLLLDSEVMEAPTAMGKFYIRKSKKRSVYLVKNLKLDWKKTREYGKYIYHLNEHSDGRFYSVKWCKSRVLKNNAFYSFVPLRLKKRRIKPLLAEGKDYLS